MNSRCLCKRGYEFKPESVDWEIQEQLHSKGIPKIHSISYLYCDHLTHA